MGQTHQNRRQLAESFINPEFLPLILAVVEQVLVLVGGGVQQAEIDDVRANRIHVAGVGVQINNIGVITVSPLILRIEVSSHIAVRGVGVIVIPYVSE